MARRSTSSNENFNVTVGASFLVASASAMALTVPSQSRPSPEHRLCLPRQVANVVAPSGCHGVGTECVAHRCKSPNGRRPRRREKDAHGMVDLSSAR